MRRRLPRVLALVTVLLAALIASMGVVLTQSEDRPRAQRQVDLLASAAGANSALAQEIALLVSSDGVEAALKKVESYRNTGEGACHDLSHAVGRSAWAEYGNVADAFNAGYALCGFGYFHGIVEAAAAETTVESFQATLVPACDALSGDETLLSQCVHGAGHGAFYLTSGDMLRAMELCSGFSELRLGAQACETGVSMEWFRLHSNPIEGMKPVVQDPRDACALMPERFKGSCFEYLFNDAVLSDGTDPSAISREAEWCDRNAGASVARCITSLARFAIVSFDTKPEVFSELCPADGSRTECVRRVLDAWAVWAGPSLEEYDAVCRSFRPSDRAADGGCALYRPTVLEIIERSAAIRPDALTKKP